MIVLFDKKENCCGCGACYNVCPKNAIKMKEDEYGFIYPEIDTKLCIECGLCKKVCAYQNIEETNKPLAGYVCANKDKNQIMLSASGGIFAAAAHHIVKQGGAVFGAAFVNEDNMLKPKHIMVNNADDIIKLQGSKYVQSDINNTFAEAEKILKEGRTVLFSGTPCQIAALKGYLRKDYDNLYTMDIICHGVPNSRFFNDYITILSKKLKGSPVDFKFRDKTNGWGMLTAFEYIKNDKHYKKFIPARTTSYFTLFLDGHTYREGCYSCKYACDKRAGDVTIGDYWGIEKQHPELMNKYNERLGISCAIVNSEKGIKLIEELNGYIMRDISSYNNIAAKNGQLTAPSKKSEIRKVVMEIYKEQGYEGVEKYFKKNYHLQIIIHTIYNKIPRKLRLKLKKLLKG